MMRFRPSKPLAVFTTAIGAVIFVLGVTSMHRPSLFQVLWVVALVGIILFVLWAAFSARGSLYTLHGAGNDWDRREGSRSGS